MLITLNWLKEVIDTNASAKEIADELLKLGIEVEIESREDLKPFVVAQIVSAKPHPSISKLTLCQVIAGGKEILQIVCGARNAKEGLKTILAPIGATIPSNGIVIEPRTLGGELSDGMLCSAAELLLDLPQQEGIIEMPLDAKPGEPLLSYFELDDVLFHLEITPNRGDCLSVYGIARELAAAGLGRLRQLPEKQVEQQHEIKKSPDFCPLFSLWSIEKIQSGAKTPEQILKRLEKAGIKPVNAPVDILNYVAHTFGQPMHAYDMHTCSGEISVEKRSGFELEALDGCSYKIAGEAISIVCNDNVIALAGIIGSNSTKVKNNTKDIIVEAGIFDSKCIGRTGQELKLNTQARHRFERGVDPALCLAAARIAVNMILEVCGGILVQTDVRSSIYVGSISEGDFHQLIQSRLTSTIKLHLTNVREILGQHVEEEKVVSILENLGFSICKSGDCLHVRTPTWRTYMELEEDVVSEIARSIGYDSLASCSIAQNRVVSHSLEDKARTICASLGYAEIISWSFVGSEQLLSFSQEQSIQIENPISQEMSFMRQSLIPQMADIVQKNNSRGAKGGSIFEIGPAFFQQEEVQTLAILKSGQTLETSVHTKTQQADIFDIKGDVNRILSILGQEKIIYRRQALPGCHPHKCASIISGNQCIGYLGVLMPTSIRQKQPEICFAEIYLSKLSLMQQELKRELKVSNYQQVQRDFAFFVDQKCELGPVLDAIKECNPEIIRDVILFDVFQGPEVPQGKKSFAVSCMMQSQTGTMSETEILSIHGHIISKVAEKFGAQPRLS